MNFCFRLGGTKTLKRGHIKVLFPHSPYQVPIYNVHETLPSVSVTYDFAVLKMHENGSYPPAFQKFDLSTDNSKEFQMYNVGYQPNSKKLFGELVVDHSVVVKAPPERKLAALNEFVKTKYDDDIGYTGLLRDGNVCQISSLIQGASGGLGVIPVPSSETVKVISMYQRGYPAYYYNHGISFHQKKAFSSSLKIESGISMAKLFSEMTLGIEGISTPC